MKARYVIPLLLVLTLGLVLPQPGQPPVAAAPLGDVIVADPPYTNAVYLPMIRYDDYSCYTGQTYGGFNPASGVADPPAALSGDLNLSLRGYDNVDSRNYTLGFVNYGGSHDSRAPKLQTLLDRQPTFIHNYQVYDWRWPSEGGANPYGSKGSRLDPLLCPSGKTCWQVSLLGLQTNVGELVYLPRSGYGDVAGGVYYALVLYATPSSITLKYTAEDNVVSGYTIHVDNVCVDPSLVAAYNTANSNGRRPLPALTWHQPFGKTSGTEIRVAIRDNGTFMDPRAQSDWWTP